LLTKARVLVVRVVVRVVVRGIKINTSH